MSRKCEVYKKYAEALALFEAHPGFPMLPPPEIDLSSLTCPTPSKGVVYILIATSEGRVIQTPMCPIVEHSPILYGHLLDFCANEKCMDPVIRPVKKFDVSTMLRIIEWCNCHEFDEIFMDGKDLHSFECDTQFFRMDPQAFAKLFEAACFLRIVTLVSFLYCPLPDGHKTGGKKKVWELFNILPPTKQKVLELNALLENKESLDDMLKRLSLATQKKDSLDEMLKRLTIAAKVIEEKGKKGAK